ncbi:MAG: hypothetical protein SGILL_006465 [Bacillariaceae sp.]
MRSLGVSRQQSSTRSFVETLESKLERSAMEDAFLRHYHRRCHERKSSKKKSLSADAAAVASGEAVVWWERAAPAIPKKEGLKKGVSFFSPSPAASTKQNSAAGSTTINLSGLQESMEKLGLSLDTLKEQDITNEDAFMT